MILSFKHRGLRALYSGRGARRVAPEHVRKLTRIAVLDRSRAPQDVNLPGFRLHPLAGQQTGYYAVSVSGNWRVTFRFEEGDVALSDLVNGKAGVSVEMSIRLARAFGSTPETWLGMQMAFDLWQARDRAEQLEVESFKAAALR